MKTLTTPEAIRAAFTTTVSALLDYDNQDFYRWQGNRLDSSDFWLEDADRAQRIHDAASDGADGSTHREHIEDFQRYADEHYKELETAIWHLSTDSTNSEEIARFEAECNALKMEMETAQEALNADIEKLTQWHVANGSIDEQIG